MDEKLNIKTIIAWTILGYICFLLMSNIESILTSLIMIIGHLTKLSPSIINYLDLIPAILILIFWIILVFKYLNIIDKDFKIETFPKRFAKNIAISVLITSIFVIGLSYAKDYAIVGYYHQDLSELGKSIEIKSYVRTIISLVTLVVITVGFIRIIKK